MRTNFICLIVLLLLELLSGQLSSYATPVDDWQKLISEGSNNKLDGQYKVAEQYFTKALDIAEHQKLPPKYLPISLCRLADVEVIINKIPEADAHLKTIVDILNKQKEAGTLDPQVNFWAAVLSDSYMGNTKPETRETCLRRACYLKVLIYGNTHKESTDCLNKLAECYIQNNKVDKAIELLTLANPILDKKSGTDSDKLGNAIHQLAVKSEALHKYKEAKQLELEVIKLAKTNSEYLSAGLPGLYYNLSMSAHIQGKIAESKHYYQLALNACPKIKNSRKKWFMLHAVQYFDSPNYNEISPALKEFELKQGLALTEAMSNDLPWQYVGYNLLCGVSGG